MDAWLTAPAPRNAGPPPDRDAWLQQPEEQIAKQLAPLGLSVLMPTDGSRRAFQAMRNANPALTRADYVPLLGARLAQLVAQWFALGVRCVIAHMFERDVFARGTPYVVQGVQAAQHILAGDTFAALYAQYDVRATVGGNWDVAGLPADEKAALRTFEAAISARSVPAGQRLLLAPFQPLGFVDEILRRQRVLIAAGDPAPDVAAVRRAAYPLGPARVDILLNNDAMRPGNYLSPLLDTDTNLYQLSFGVYDLTAAHMRSILYDAAYLRRGPLPDGALYGPDDARAFAAHAAAQRGRIAGLGRQIGPGIWQLDLDLR
jgi:hypothetical protein